MGSIARRATGGLRFVLALALMAALATVSGGCQLTQAPIATEKLIQHHNDVEKSGLAEAATVGSLKAVAAAPLGWRIMPLQSNLLYKHQHWLSPTKATGAGVAYVHTPLPMTAQALIWFARSEYSKRANGGKILAEWTDSLGRAWFEAENDKYHIRGYAVTEGFDGWIVYSGYKTFRPTNEAEIELATRCAESVVPNITKPASKSLSPAGN